MHCMMNLSPQAEQALDVAAARYALQTQPDSADLLDKVRAIELAVKRRRAPLSALLGALMLFGCSGPQAPSFFSISSEFAAGEAEVIRDAVAAWCEKTGDCPKESLFSEEAHFKLVDDLPEDEQTEKACPEGATCRTNANEARGTIRIARNRAPGLDTLWRIAAHEWGHLCIDGHVEDSSLMKALQSHGEALEVDDEAASGWRAGCR